MKKVAIAVLSLASLLLLPGAEAESRRWSPSIGRPPQPGDEYINPADGSVLVFIPGGEFLMGTDGGEADERPAHRVKVEGFWLGKYEVTNKQYMKFMEEEGYPDPAFMDDPDFNHPSQPVLGIKFLHALEYMKWSGLRMPTEAEWEYAASGGKRLEYPTATGKLDHTQANFLGREGPDIWADKPSPVGSFPAGPYGLFDLAGNAWGVDFERLQALSIQRRRWKRERNGKKIPRHARRKLSLWRTLSAHGTAPSIPHAPSS